MQTQNQTTSSVPLAPGHISPDLTVMRACLGDGEITDMVQFQSGLFLHSDPALKVQGRYRSPSGRLLELEIITAGVGDWIALHVELANPDLSGCTYLGFASRSAAPKEQMIRACLRSGTDAGFVDCFFDKHILAVPDPRNHVDALHIATHRILPEIAAWRELILFLPPRSLRWDLHDLRLFAI